MSSTERSGVTAPAEDSDALLLARIAGGDVRGAGQRLVERYYRPLYRKLLYWCDGHVETAEELTQRTFEKVLRGAKDFRGDAKFSTWLHTAARNTFIDYCRHDRSRNYLSLSEEQDDEDEMSHCATLADADCSPDNLLLRVKDREAVHRALMQLKPIYKEVIVLRFFEDHSVEEIAAMTGQKFETIRTRIRYAQDQLRVSLKDAVNLDVGRESADLRESQRQ